MTRSRVSGGVWGALLVLTLSVLGDAAPPAAADPLVLVYEGSRLSVRKSAPVVYPDVSEMLAALGRESHAGRYAIVLFRDSPREIVGYVPAVGPEGTLSLGSQLQEWDPSGRRYRLVRGELFRSYQPLEGNAAWTWFVTIPVSRELQAALVIQAAGTRWPVGPLSISVQSQPAH